MAFGAMDEQGNPVDWWFIYKVAGKSSTGTGARHPVIRGAPVRGVEYLYFDANAKESEGLELSTSDLDSAGALPHTLSQIYGATDPNVGWFCYNDENPIDDTINSSRGHTKGMLAFDLASDTGVWLIHSAPKFSPQGAYAYPETATPNAQTMLCITLQNADVARKIAEQMVAAQQPNVYLASSVPADLANAVDDARVMLMRDQVKEGEKPLHVVVPFVSQGGTKFTSIAKNKSWGLDFYTDLVGPTLHEDLDVETWEHDPVPPGKDSDRRHTVVDMKAVNLRALGIDLAWPEADDHAKLAISARSEHVHYVCVGDLNFTIAQRKRGGGTVAFRCEPLWRSISSILEDVCVPTPDRTAVAAPTAASATSPTTTTPLESQP